MPKWSVGTRRLYGAALHRWLLDLPTDSNASDMAVSRVTAADISEALRDVAKVSGPGMAKTVRTARRHVFRLAVRRRAIEHNPVRGADPIRVPKVKRGSPDKFRTFSRAESDRIVAFAAGDDRAQARDLADLLAFLDGAGVRIGEACALRRVDLDLVRGLAVVGDREHDALGARAHARSPCLSGSPTGCRSDQVLDRRNRLGLVFPAPLTGELRDPSNTAHHVRDLLNAVEGDDGEPMTWASARTYRRWAVGRLHLGGRRTRASPLRVVGSR